MNRNELAARFAANLVRACAYEAPDTTKPEEIGDYCDTIAVLSFALADALSEEGKP